MTSKEEKNDDIDIDIDIDWGAISPTWRLQEDGERSPSPLPIRNKSKRVPIDTKCKPDDQKKTLTTISSTTKVCHS